MCGINLISLDLLFRRFLVLVLVLVLLYYILGVWIFFLSDLASLAGDGDSRLKDRTRNSEGLA